MTCDPVHLRGISLNFGHVIMTCDPTYNQSQKLKKKKKTRNTGTRNNGKRKTGGTAEHPGKPAEHPKTTKPYKTMNNCSLFKRKFKTQNLNYQLKVETIFIADINYLFISLYLRLVYMWLKKILTNK